MSANDNSNQLHLTRLYDASVKQVWDAWTDPERAAKWWGPRGFTITTHSKELKPGGIWHYTMHGPDGTDYPNKAIYLEVETQKKLVYDHGGYDDRPPLFRVTVLFTAQGDQTKMDMTMTMPTPEAAVEIGKIIKQASGYSTWDRLAEYLEKESSGKERFVINRTFDTSQKQMFEMWTNADHFSQWLPPTGFEMKFLRADIRAGGSTFYVMTNNADVTMYGRCEYHELEPPCRIVYTQQFCDEYENISRHPMAPVWPANIYAIVEITAESAERSRVTVTWEPSGEVTPEELAAFVAERGGMTQGWTGSFDKLENYLTAASTQ